MKSSLSLPRWLAAALAALLLGTAPAIAEPFWKPISSTLNGETFHFASVQEREHFDAQVRAGGDVIYMPLPHYPTRGRWFRREGTGILRMTFTKLGKPAAAQIVKSTGFKILDQAAKDEALYRWRLVRHAGGFPVVKNATIQFVLR